MYGLAGSMTTRSTGLSSSAAGIVDQIRVQRIVAGDQHDQRTLAAPARAAGLLPEGRNRPGKTGEHHRVQPGNVDTQLQRVGGGQAAQSALGQGTLQRVAVLGEIAGPVGRHGVRQLRSNVVQPRLGAQRGQFGSAPGTHEGQGLRSLGDQVGHHPRRLRAGGTAHRGTVLAGDVGAQRGLPQRHGAGPLR